MTARDGGRLAVGLELNLGSKTGGVGVGAAPEETEESRFHTGAPLRSSRSHNPYQISQRSFFVGEQGNLGRNRIGNTEDVSAQFRSALLISVGPCALQTRIERGEPEPTHIDITVGAGLPGHASHALGCDTS